MTKLTGSLGVRNEINVDIIGTGPRGKEGKSAYEIWLDLGNEGTEQEYLASLKGDKGEPGEPGEPGIQGAPGAPGENGADGQDGAPGADGITPHIGPNGNWFVGDIDTSIKAEGQDGKDGDPLQIVNDLTTGGADKALSAEQGKVLNGQLHKPYELIETITLTEDTAVVIRTQEPDGTPYSFKAVYITMKAVAPSVSYQPRLWAMYNDKYLNGKASTPGNISTEYDSYCTSITELINGMWQNKSVAPQKGDTWTGGLNSSVGYNPMLEVDAPICNRVVIQKSSSLAWEIGCVFKIYGVRV